MRCQDVRSLVKPYYEGTIEEFSKIKIHHHLVGCKQCTEDYEIWLLGEEIIHYSAEGKETLSVELNQLPNITNPSSSNMMKHVMGRIQAEEKWANPSVKHKTTYSNRNKTLYSSLASMVLICFILLFATTMISDGSVFSGSAEKVDIIKELDINKIVMKEQVHQSETRMDFQVVASLNDPIIYTLPINKNQIPYGVIFSVFGILCMVLGMSWITRV
jgi:hypothetical protein